MLSEHNSESVLQTVNINRSLTTAVVVHQHGRGPVVNCHIEGLEVYRGRQRTLDIGQNHGFSLTDEGTIKVSVHFSSSTRQIKSLFYILSPD